MGPFSDRQRVRRIVIFYSTFFNYFFLFLFELNVMSETIHSEAISINNPRPPTSMEDC